MGRTRSNYSRMAGYEDVNDAMRLSQDPFGTVPQPPEGYTCKTGRGALHAESVEYIFLGSWEVKTEILLGIHMQPRLDLRSWSRLATIAWIRTLSATSLSWLIA